MDSVATGTHDIALWGREFAAKARGYTLHIYR